MAQIKRVLVELASFHRAKSLRFGLDATVIFAMLILMATATVATAQTYTVLYNFGANSGEPNDPQYSGIIAEGPDGTMYSTTNQNWTGGAGDVFSITPTGVVTVLHNFSGPDGQFSVGGLTMASDGNLYGTTQLGGADGNGTVFRITPAGDLTTLYNFTGGDDGGSPRAPPIQGTDGNFYGTTTGGTINNGSIYMITSAGTLTTLHSFAGTDGSDPIAPLVQATDGNFYGTTFTGGTNGSGTIFKISSSGTFDVMFNFGQVPGYPYAPLIQGTDGNFYGTAAGASGGSTGGVVFQMMPSGTVTVLHTFTGGTDGGSPVGGLAQGLDGNFYGTDDNGGVNCCGVLFRINSTGTFATLYSFGATTGASPQVTLLQHTNGLLYGDTAAGGAYDDGAFYSFSVNLPVASLNPNALTFATQAVDTTSAAQVITLSNAGTESFNVTQIVASGDFAETNNCSTSLAAGASCQIPVTFTPSATGNQVGAITFTDTAAGSPQAVGLSGVGIAPGANVSPPSLTFPGQYVGTAGLNQNVTLTNNGNAALAVTNVTASPSSDFSELSTCGNSLAVGASCSVGVFFDPSASGSRSGTLTITDNAPGSPQVVALSGTGEDFSMSASSSSQTVSAGQTASYSLVLVPEGGFKQTVQLSCSGAPAQSSCSVSPATATLNGSQSEPVTVTVATIGSSAALSFPPEISPLGNIYGLWLSFSGILGLAMFVLLARSRLSRGRGSPGALAVLCLLAMMMPACGGGTNSRSGASTETPAGSYNLTVTAVFTSGSTNLEHTTKLTLVVQ